jgi:hypothetical protein
MAPFDASGVPQQGQPNVAQQMMRSSMPPGHVVQGNPSSAGIPAGHPMSNPAYNHQHRNGVMPVQPPQYHSSGMPSQSPSRQGNFGPPQGYSSHPPLHSPHQSGPPQMHPPMQRVPPPGQQMHRGSMGSMGPAPPHHGMGQGMPMHMQQQQHHDQMRSVSTHSQGGMQQPRQQQQQYIQQQHNQSTGMTSGNWQSDKDTPHRRDMIQKMYVYHADVKKSFVF